MLEIVSIPCVEMDGLLKKDANVLNCMVNSIKFYLVR